MFIAVISGAFAGAMIWSYVQIFGDWQGVDYWLERYQTLAGGGVALLTLHFLSAQLRLQRRQQLVDAKLRNRPERDALERARWFAMANDELIFYQDGKEVGWMHPIMAGDRDRTFLQARLPPHILSSFDQFEAGCRTFQSLVTDLTGAEPRPTQLASLRSKSKYVETLRQRLLRHLDNRASLLDLDERDSD